MVEYYKNKFFVGKGYFRKHERGGLHEKGT